MEVSMKTTRGALPLAIPEGLTAKDDPVVLSGVPSPEDISQSLETI